MIYVEKVFEITKKVRTETKIGINPLSVSGLSFNLVKEIFENPENKEVLVIGGGDLAKSILKNLFDKGLRSISAINRTIKEIKISEDFSIIPMPLNLVHRELLMLILLFALHQVLHQLSVKEQLKMHLKIEETNQ